jgi:hypothetical protein
MKTPGLSFAFSSVVLLPIFLSVQGCSLIGLGIGAIADGNRPDTTNVTSWSIETIPIGQDVTLSLNDGYGLGYGVSGEYAGLALDSLNQYNARYEKFLAARDVPLPLPPVGDTVSIVFKRGQGVAKAERIQRQVAAYGYNGIYFLVSPNGTIINLYAHIDTLIHNGMSWSGDDLRWVVVREHVPVRDMVVLRGDPPDTARRSVPLSDVNQISYETSKNGKAIGFFVGLAVDVVVIIVVATNAEEEKPKPTTGQGSCPFVYSYDGREYVLDSETFSGAICRSLQRADWDNLDHLVAVGGICSLKVENRLPETQYVDALKLLVVEHPQGSTIIADAPGVIHAVGQAREPIEALDLAGSVVTPLVRASDSLAWISNPAGRDPDRDASVRDGLTVRFDRPPDADSARLILKLRNTLWSTEIEERLLRLQGSYLDYWYDAMNSSSEFRDSFVEIVQREAMLNVQVWTGDAWKSIRFIPFPGPYVDKSYVVPLDLRQVTGSDLRVRVESTVGLWVINSIAMDFTAPLPVHMTEAPVIRALDRQGNDVRQALSSSDERYHVLSTGDLLKLAFSAPPARPGYARSFVLESAGYYTIHVTPSGSPQLELLDSFTNEPGAFGRYTLRVFHSWLSRELGALR